MGLKTKIAFSTVVLAGAAVAGLWWIGRRSLMAKRELAVTASLVQANDQAALEAPPQTTEPPPPAALPAT
jgi:hypothetical protein